MRLSCLTANKSTTRPWNRFCVAEIQLLLVDSSIVADDVVTRIITRLVIQSRQKFVFERQVLTIYNAHFYAFSFYQPNPTNPDDLFLVL